MENMHELHHVCFAKFCEGSSLLVWETMQWLKMTIGSLHTQVAPAWYKNKPSNPGEQQPTADIGCRLCMYRPCMITNITYYSIIVVEWMLARCLHAPSPSRLETLSAQTYTKESHKNVGWHITSPLGASASKIPDHPILTPEPGLVPPALTHNHKAHHYLRLHACSQEVRVRKALHDGW